MKNVHTKQHLSFHSFSLPFSPFYSLLLIFMILVSCEKENTSGNTPTPQSKVNALVLNEGNWGSNNSTLTAIDITDGSLVANDWFSACNGRGLGDVAQDMLLYGSKVYVTVTFSNSLEVIDTASGLARRVELAGMRPRNIAAANGKLYVSCYNPRSVVRIDTATLNVEATCSLGDYQPEGLAVCDGKLFVTSSFIQDGQDYRYDDKIYVIDLATFANPQTVTVGANPQDIMVIADGKVIVNYWGDYGSHPAGTAIIDATTLDVNPTGQALSRLAVYNRKAYGYVTEYDADWNQTVSYKTIDANGNVGNFPFSVSISENPYGITVNPANGDIYVLTDGNYSANGSLYCYTTEGSLKFTLEAGLLPKKVVFF